MPKGNEIVTTYNIDRLEFVELVQDGKLTALWDLQPINWQDEEAAFIKCQHLVSSCITITKETNRYTRKWNDQTHYYSEIPRANSNSAKPVALWSVLAKKLTQAKRPIDINPTQFRILSESNWGPAALELVAMEADYARDDTKGLSEQKCVPEKNEEVIELSAVDQLQLLTLETLWPEATRQQKKGFEEFKKNLEKHFHAAVRAAVVVITYCQQQDQKISNADLHDLFARPNDFPGAEKFKEYSEMPKEFIHDIYTQLPAQYRLSRGEKKGV